MDLFSGLDEVTGRIGCLDPTASQEPFARTLQELRGDMLCELAARQGPVAVSRACHILAGEMLALIREIPPLITELKAALLKPGINPALSCAVMGALAYLVEPRDLLPDDLPGGYGFVDDFLILRVCSYEYFELLPPGFTTRDRERWVLKSMGLCVPSDRIDEVQRAIEGVWHLFHRLLAMPSEEVRSMAESLRCAPLGNQDLLQSDAQAFSPGPQLCSRVGEVELSLGGEELVVCWAPNMRLRLSG